MLQNAGSQWKANEKYRTSLTWLTPKSSWKLIKIWKTSFKPMEWEKSRWQADRKLVNGYKLKLKFKPIMNGFPPLLGGRYFSKSPSPSVKSSTSWRHQPRGVINIARARGRKFPGSTPNKRDSGYPAKKYLGRAIMCLIYWVTLKKNYGKWC